MDSKVIKDEIKKSKEIVENLNNVGIQSYTNKFIWNKIFNSYMLKGGMVGNIITSIIFMIASFPITAYIIPMILMLTSFGISFWMYRIFLVDKYAKLGAEEYLKKLNFNKEHIVKNEYILLKELFYTNINYSSEKNLLKRKIYDNIVVLQNSYEKFNRVVNSQTIINKSLKDSLLIKANKTYLDGIVVLKEIYDIFIAESESSNREKMLQKNEENVLKLLELIIQMQNSLEKGALEVPQISSSQSSIEKATDSVNELIESMEQAKMVQGNEGKLDNIYNKYSN